MPALEGVDAVEPEPLEAEPFDAEPYEPEDNEEAGTGRSGRRLASFIVPIAFAIYIVISVVFGDR